MNFISNSWGTNGFTARDAWILARLQTGLAEEPDLTRASAGFLAIARRIYEATPSERPPIIEDWLRSCPDTAAIEHAVSATKSNVPAADADEERQQSSGMVEYLKSFEPYPTKWLWRDRIPMGRLTAF